MYVRLTLLHCFGRLNSCLMCWYVLALSPIVTHQIQFPTPKVMCIVFMVWVVVLWLAELCWSRDAPKLYVVVVVLKLFLCSCCTCLSCFVLLHLLSLPFLHSMPFSLVAHFWILRHGRGFRCGTCVGEGFGCHPCWLVGDMVRWPFRFDTSQKFPIYFSLCGWGLV